MIHGVQKNITAYSFKRIILTAMMSACFIGVSFAQNSANEKLRKGVTVRDIEIIQSALQAGADPNHVPEGTVSTLWIAVNGKSLQVLELLLENGGDPNQINSYGTPLLYTASRVNNASRDKSSQVVKLLLRYGADIEIMDKKKRYRPLKVAATFGTYATLKTLLENGADPNNVPDNGHSALVALSINKHCKLDCVELLLAYGANPDLPGKKGSSTYRESVVKSNDRARIQLIEKYFPTKK